MTQHTPATERPRPRSRREILEAMAAALALAACGTAPAGGAGGAGGDAAAGADGLASADTGASAGLDAVADAASDATLDATADTAVDAAIDAAVDTGTGLPSGAELLTPVTPNEYYFITSCCGTPDVDASTWSIEVVDRGKPLGTIDMALLDSLAATTKEHTLECISAREEAQKIGNAVWTGLPLTAVFEAAKIAQPKGVDTLICTGADEYTTGLHVSDLTQPIWLVWRMNGEPLPKAHGYPARLLVPGRYGMKSPKWLTRLEFVEGGYLGYWEAAGWSDEATIAPHVWVRYPELYETLAPGPLRIGGSAFAGLDPVAKVEVRVDGGAWQPAVLDYDAAKGDAENPGPKPDVWTLWHLDLVATKGSLLVETRCTTLGGKVSALVPNPGPDGYVGGMKASWAVDAP